MKIKILSIRIKIEDKGLSYIELVNQARKGAEKIDGFIKLEVLEESNTIDQDELDDLASELDLSPNQIRFVEDALMAGLEVKHDYSGRGMRGKTCPAVKLSSGESFRTEASFREDTLGRRRVYYAPS